MWHSPYLQEFCIFFPHMPRVFQAAESVQAVLQARESAVEIPRSQDHSGNSFSRCLRRIGKCIESHDSRTVGCYFFQCFTIEIPHLFGLYI